MTKPHLSRDKSSVRNRIAVIACVLSIGVVSPLARAQEASGEATSPAEAATDTATADAASDETPEYREALERFEGAQALFDRGDYSAALAEFQRIYDLLEGHANRYFVLFNLGRSYEELHRYDRAIEFYQRYLEEGGAEADGRADVEASLRALERLLGTLVITLEGLETATPPIESVEVWLEDRLVGEAPGEVRVPGGQHVIELRAQGFETARQEIQVASRSRVTLHVVMHPLSSFRGVSPAIFVASTAVAVLAAGVGAGMGLWAISLSDQGTACGERAGCTIDPLAQSQQIRDVALTADILFATAGLFALTSVVLAFVTDWGGVDVPVDEDESSPTVVLLPMIAPGFAGGMLTLEL